MSLDHLWAGWRAAYVASVGTGPAGEPTVDGGEVDAGGGGCVFCRIAESTEPDEVRHVVATTEKCVVLLNAFPYASGHLLVLPHRHVEDLADLQPDESSDLWQTALVAASTIRRAYDPDGLNLGANLGRAAGAGIPGHLHLHLVPRWTGDTNFMTTVASVRVLPEALSDSWAKLHAAWPA